MRRDHWTECWSRAAVRLFPPALDSRFVYGDDGRAIRSADTRLCRTSETGGGSHISFERHSRRARAHGKKPDVREDCAHHLRSETTEETELHRAGMPTLCAPL